MWTEENYQGCSMKFCSPVFSGKLQLYRTTAKGRGPPGLPFAEHDAPRRQICARLCAERFFGGFRIGVCAEHMGGLRRQTEQHAQIRNPIPDGCLSGEESASEKNQHSYRGLHCGYGNGRGDRAPVLQAVVGLLYPGGSPV